MNNRVLVAMSGGVDSSVAAYLLKEQGYDVIGAIMTLKRNPLTENCPKDTAVEDARNVCQKLDIPFYEFDFVDSFENKIINYFIKEYMQGRTPNPCVACNKLIKFDEFYNKAKELDAKYMATGHYAKIIYDAKIGRYLIKKSASAAKDQTYVLYNLKQDQLKHILMPLGEYSKDEIRSIAEKIGLIIADKPDSQEICFIEDNDYIKFIKEQSEYDIKPGSFIDTEGNILGEHKGIINYTIGQRKGIGISFGKPMYVIDINPDKNIVVLGDEKDIFKKELIADNLNYILFDNIDKPIKVKAKIRYAASESDATIIPIDESRVKVVFDKAQRAITKGQSIVFYHEEYLLGGGIIIEN